MAYFTAFPHNTVTKSHLIKFSIACATGLLFSGCQSLPSGSATILSNTTTAVTAINTPPLNNADSQATLMGALKRALYHNQDWVTYQQLRVLSVADLPASDTPNWVKIEKCQSEHDSAYAQQLKADHLNSNEAVAKLSKEKSQPYEALKTAYLACAHTAKLEPTLDSNQAKAPDKTTDKSAETTDSSETSSAILQDTSGWLKLEPAQAKLMNTLVSNSASIQYTGIYRPLQGRVAVQADVGFDNKNTHYHYRLPLVLDINNASLYVKPDVFMPFVSIYLDNQLGISWQDKWYKFSETADNKLPARITKNAVIQAIKTSVNALPASQFSSFSPAQIQALAQQVASSVPQNTQPLALTRQSVVIEWRQTASEQAAFLAQIKQAFIQNMDNAMQNDPYFLTLSPTEQAQYRTRWQAYKTRLTSNTLDESNQNLLKKLALHTQKGQGQTLDFVLENGSLKHIYQQQLASFSQKPFQLTTWHTFSPNTHSMAMANQPNTLANLTQTIHDTPNGGNVLDGQQEIQRIKHLDDSRRLFGRQAGIFKSYDEYKKIDTPASTAKKSALENSDNRVPEKMSY